MLRKFADLKTCDERAVFFTNICTLMHNLTFTWNKRSWSFQYRDDTDLKNFARQSMLKLQCRMDNVNCHLCFLMEDAEFFLRTHYEANTSSMAVNLQKLLWRQAVNDLLTTGQNTFVVQNIEFQTMSVGALASSRRYLCTPFDLFINNIRLRGLLRLPYDDMNKWYRFYRKYSNHVQHSIQWQDTPLIFSVILGETVFEMSDFLQNRFDIREQDVIVIENAPPDGCVWIDMGGYLLLARYDQHTFILQEEIIMAENKTEDMRKNNTVSNEENIKEENSQDEESTANEESEEQESEEQESEEQESDQEEAVQENADRESSERKSTNKNATTEAESTEEESSEDQAANAGQTDTTQETNIQTASQAGDKLPQVSADRLSRASLNTAIKKMSVHVVFELSRVQIPLSDLQKLNKGYVFNLHQKSDAGINIIVNEKVVARGELVKIADSLGVRITKVF